MTIGMVKTMWKRFAAKSRDDSGSALMMAIGVALLGVALATIVVAQAVTVSRDSGRDRIRTIEVHAAEAVLDATMLAMETGSPCSSTDQVIGSGATAVSIDVDIAYFDEDGDSVSCTDAATGVARSAEVSVAATSDVLGFGVAPERDFSASVQLAPIVSSEPATAIFSTDGFAGTGGGFTLTPIDPTAATTIWVDGDLSDGAGGNDYECSTSTIVDGDVIVTDGKVILRSNSCEVNGSAWARTGFENSNAPLNTYTVVGDVVVYDGNYKVNNKTVIGGNLAVGGWAATTNGNNSQWWWSNGGSTVYGGVCSDDTTACGDLPLYEPRGLPEVDYKPADWTGFTFYDKDDYDDRFISQWGLSEQWQKDAVRNSNCQALGWLSSQPITFPSTPSVYDLRNCGFSTNGTVTFRFCADTAFFSKSFHNSNQFNLQSCDGNTHKVWIIVPEGGTPNNGVAELTCRSEAWGNYCPGDISIAGSGVTVDPDIQIFLYTPGDLTYHSQSDIYGEIYGGDVTVGAGGQNFYYVGTGVPGVNLTSGASTSSDGYDVGIKSKHETR